MAEQKTKPTKVSVNDFLDTVASEQVRDDCREIIKMMKKVTGSPPKMWGPSIIGFGQYHYKYESGHEGDACIAGFSPRKGNITIYTMPGIIGQDELYKKLGKFKSSKACLYIKKLDDIDMSVLEKIVKGSVDWVKKTYPSKK